MVLTVMRRGYAFSQVRRRGPLGDPSVGATTSERGGSDAQARRREGRSEAQEQQERGGETVEDTFEVCERHDTHTL